MCKASVAPRSLDRGLQPPPSPQRSMLASAGIQQQGPWRPAQRSAALDVFQPLGHAQLFTTPWTAGPSVPGISQTRVLERVAISFSGGSSQHGDRTCISHLAGRFFTTEPLVKPSQGRCVLGRQSATTRASSRVLGGSAPGSLHHLSSETQHTLMWPPAHKRPLSLHPHHTPLTSSPTAHALLRKGKSLFKSSAHLPKKCL